MFPFSLVVWVDALVLFLCYGLYVRESQNEPEEHADLIGPPIALAALPRSRRRWTTFLLFAWSAAVILASAEPFAESLVHGGELLGAEIRPGEPDHAGAGWRSLYHAIVRARPSSRSPWMVIAIDLLVSPGAKLSLPAES